MPGYSFPPGAAGGGGGGAGLVPTGAQFPYGGDVAPAGYLLEDGSAVSRVTFADLFAILGIKYGPGDGFTTFNLPDKRGRFSLGKDDMGGVPAGRVTDPAASIVGDGAGFEDHTLTFAELPVAQYPIAGGGAAFDAGGNYSDQTGGGGAHEVMNPYQTDNWIVKT